MKNEPSLDDLGLGEPAKPSGKISIESLQRQGDHEQNLPQQISKPFKRSVALDVVAGFIALLIPGLGHVIKGKGITGAFWFFAYLASVVAIFFFFPAILLAAAIAIANVVSAVCADQPM